MIATSESPSATMEKGQAAKDCTVSSLTVEPKNMPVQKNAALRTPTGIKTSIPMSVATATAMSAPLMKAAGNPKVLNRSAPHAPTTSVRTSKKT